MIMGQRRQEAPAGRALGAAANKLGVPTVGALQAHALSCD